MSGLGISHSRLICQQHIVACLEMGKPAIAGIKGLSLGTITLLVLQLCKEPPHLVLDEQRADRQVPPFLLLNPQTQQASHMTHNHTPAAGQLLGTDGRRCLRICLNLVLVDMDRGYHRGGQPQSPGNLRQLLTLFKPPTSCAG